MTVSFVGDTRQWKIGAAALAPLCAKAAKADLRTRMQAAFEKSQEEVPVDTGRLRASGRLEERDTPYELEIDLIYGGGDVDYAGWVEIFEPYLEETADGELALFGSDGETLEEP